MNKNFLNEWLTHEWTQHQRLLYQLKRELAAERKPRAPISSGEDTPVVEITSSTEPVNLSTEEISPARPVPMAPPTLRQIPRDGSRRPRIQYQDLSRR